MYEFNQGDAYRFAKHVGIRARSRNGQLRFDKCPYCQSEDKDTFAISLETGQFKCLRASCGASGNMVTLHKDFNFSLGSSVDEYIDQRKQYRTFIKSKDKPESKPKAIEYLESRGIDKEIAEKYNITTHKDHDNVLVFPFYDETDTLRLIKYRDMDYDKSKGGNKEWCEKDCKPILFGMNHCKADVENGTLIITEGQIDSLSVAQAGYNNVISVPFGKNGFSWIPYCWDWLHTFQTIIIFGDHEHGEITLLEDMRQRFNGVVKSVKPSDYKDCKDANEILQKYGPEQIKECISNAELPPVKEIKDITEAKKVNISDLEKCPSGIFELDKLLGGFYFGQLIILTGERGKGKSTLASQFGTIAVKNGYNCFFYSGELMDWYFRNWIDLQIAGGSHINKLRTPYGSYEYSVDGNIYPQIESWYHDRIKLYDNSIIDDDEHDTLLDTIEKAIKQYDCRVIFVDNLMTAMDDNISADLNRQQTQFVKKLSKIAKKFNVIIFLIAHPKKNQFGKFDFGNDDISGSSNITNLADVVMRYDEPMRKKGEDEEMESDSKPDRLLQVLKNRLTGKVDRVGIPLYYQESSKRISGTKDCFDWELGWENGTNDNTIDDMEIPF